MTGGLYTMWRPYIKQLSFVLGFMCQQMIVRRAAVVYANRGQGLEGGKQPSFSERGVCLNFVEKCLNRE